MKNIVFSEDQKFDNKWLWIAIGVVMIIPVILALLVKKGIMISVLIAIPVLILLLLMRLKTEIGEEGIIVKFFPVIILNKLIKWEDIEQIYIRKYKPIAEYGGWGLRISYKHGLAYNVKGNKGIQIIFKDGKQLLIGTQKPEAAAVAIRQFKALRPSSGDLSQ